MKTIPFLLSALLACLPAWAQQPGAPIPFSQLGAKATADYHGDALAVEATDEGVRLRTAFQKLAGTVTRAGLTLDSTTEGGGATAALRQRRRARGARGAMVALPSTGCQRKSLRRRRLRRRQGRSQRRWGWC